MNSLSLSRHLAAFARLHRNIGPRGAAPHKPVLLLAILHEIEAGRVTGNRVPITAELTAAFHLYWEALVPTGSGWQERMFLPFRHLRQDGFWELVQNGVPVEIDPKKSYTLNQLAALCDGGRFADDLWPLLAASATRGLFRQTLFETYFSGQAVAVPAEATATFLYAQAERLKQQAQARFVVRKVAEKPDDFYFVRNRLFPTVIKDLYGNTCCVCGVSARLGSSNLVDGAHIKPFAEFHNDDPRNGLCLCKNHHWGFDRGAWSLTDDYTVLRTDALRGSGSFVDVGKKIDLPDDAQYHPAPNALHWHRDRFGFAHR